MERQWDRTAIDCNDIVHITPLFSLLPQVNGRRDGNGGVRDEETALWAGREGDPLLLSGQEQQEQRIPANSWIFLLPD